MTADTTFSERLQTWARQFIVDLRRRWWWVFVLGPTVSFIWLLVLDRIVGSTNKIIDRHLSLSAPKPIALALEKGAASEPAFVLIAGPLIPFVMIVIFAYLETRAVEEQRGLVVQFVRSHLMPRNALHAMTDQLLASLGRDNYEMESDFLFEIFVVNENPKLPITIREFICEAKIGEEWKRLSRINDLSPYQIEQSNEQIESSRRDLVNLADLTHRVSLTYAIGYRGWLRFELIAAKKILEGQVLTRLSILEAFGKSYPAQQSAARDAVEGRLTHNPAKIFQR